MTRPARFTFAILVGLVVLPHAHGAARKLPTPDFDKVVAPLLARRCLGCHSGLKPKGGLDLSRQRSVLAGGTEGPAVVPGKLDDSLLWERVRDGEMPPKKPLAEAEKAILKRWIRAGARWGTDPIDPFRFTTETRAGYDWWALQPVRRPPPPAVKEAAWPRNPIDRFILARLEARGLKPAAEADRRTLIRRLSFDLLGLPPTPEEVRAFVADGHPLAYERLVDRLLGSPHYGERWGRHWLDVVRYGESDGFERNTPRRNSWPYRDWVIRSLNADLPYDEFCRLQVAGDVLAPDELDAVRATGFLVAGIHNTVVAANAEAQEQARQDELEDLTGTVGQTFLGLTVNCARCHDHKFDPIPQKDYYRLAAVLAGVQHGERALPRISSRTEIARMRKVLAGLESQIAAIEGPARRAVLAARHQAVPAVMPPRPLAAWDFRSGLQDRVGKLHGIRVGAARRTSAGLVVDGKSGFVRTVALAQGLREKTLEAWVRLDNLTQRGGGVFSVQTPGGAVFDAIVFGEKEPGRWLAGSNFFRRTASFGGPAETRADRQTVHVAIVYRADGTIAAYRNGKPHGKPYRSSGPVTFRAGKAVVAFGLRHEPAGGNKMLAGVIVQARLYDRALSSRELAASAAAAGVFVTEAELSSRLSVHQRSRRSALLARQTHLFSDLARLESQGRVKVYAAVAGKPPATRLRVGGQLTRPAEVIAPGGIAALVGIQADFGLRADAPEALRRQRFAAWLTHQNNPLFARVMVNRLWHYHFGVGIVETPSDFGFNGGRPSHPELLDWLAAEFVARNFRLKEMHRLIMTSAAYRQGSAPHARGLTVDADNRLLWRKKPQRMEAEVLRDSLLAVSGLLNRKQGGRGFSDYRENSLNGTTYFEPVDQAAPAFHRRSIYRFVPRGGNQGLLDVFDCPDPAAAAPRRSATTTPLQALALWNNAFALRMAEALAKRIEAEVPGKGRKALDRQVARAFQRALQRQPGPEERDLASRLAADHGLKALCRAILNSNEFLTVD